MFYDLWYRIALGVLVVWLYYDRHVARGARRGQKEKLPLQGIDRWFTAAAVFWTLSLALYIAGFEIRLFSVPVPQWLRLTGVVMMGMCIPLSKSIYDALGVGFSRTLETQDGRRLVQEGPFAYVRHPMYMTLCLCAVGACLLSANYLVTATTLVVAALVPFRIKKEEAALTRRHGLAYQLYQQRVRWTLFPKIL